MKGISLAIETIIVVILAVSVLTVMLFFFRSQAGPAQDTLTMLNLQASACSGYLFYDSGCSGDIDSELEGADGLNKIYENIAKACKGLNKQRGDYPACAGLGSADPSDNKGLTCVQQCCKTFCPRIPG